MRSVRLSVELDALKPGNVSVHLPGHGMRAEDFVRSAQAIAPVLAVPALSVGERILGAIRATRRVVDCNTNWHRPAVCAARTCGCTRPRRAIAAQRLAPDITGARCARRATRLCSDPSRATGWPGHGARAYDVSASEPQISLLQAGMRVAAGHDRIARQYISGYADVFEVALPRLRVSLARWGSSEWATVAAYLALLAAIPDTHIERKFGLCRAEVAPRRRDWTRCSAGTRIRAVARRRPGSTMAQTEGYQPRYLCRPDSCRADGAVPAG